MTIRLRPPPPLSSSSPPLSPEEKIEMRAEILRYLDKLGVTNDEIAQSLQDLGITGRCADAFNCVLAEYLHQMMPQHKFLVSNGFVLMAHNGDKGANLPLRFGMFIHGFDAGKYPQLVKTL